MGKDLHIMYNVGRVKYLVCYNDGLNKYDDGSPFYRIATFSNKRKADRFVREKYKEGYQYKQTKLINQ